jgi:uncharacterized protein YjiS (DUF1127 family)
MLHLAKVVKASALVRWVNGRLPSTLGALAWMGRVASQRRALRLLDDHQLKDLGLSRADALREANRPFWDVPPRVPTASSRVAARAPRGPRPRAGVRVPRAA